MSITCLLLITKLDQLWEKNIAAILKSRESHGIHREKEKKATVQSMEDWCKLSLKKEQYRLWLGMYPLYLCTHVYTHIYTNAE